MMTSSKNMYILFAMMMMSFLINPVLISSSSWTSEGFDEYYSEEREALLRLRDSVSSNSSNLHSNWTGPPCNNINSSKWSGIACSNWHVVHLVLEGTQLAATIAPAGSLPPTFLQNITFLSKLSFRNNTFSGPIPNLSNLVHLEYVDFSYNRFWGSIPFEYTTDLPKLELLELQENSLDGSIPPFDQPTLRAFNVSHNHLDGPIPNTGVLQKFPKSSYDHNANLCGSPLGISCTPPPSPNSPPNDSKDDLPLALIVAAAAAVPFFVIFVFLCYYKKVHGKDQATSTDQAEQTEWAVAQKKMPVDDHLDERLGDPEKRVELEFFDKDLPAAAFFDLDDLLRASAEVLGRGKLGTSYKVTLESGPVVVVKRLRSMNELGKKEFVQQMQLLGKMRHENLVQILSFYYSKEEKLVIYKFVSGATTLFELLHGNRGVGRVALASATRLSIIKSIAKGLIFLHQSLRSHKVPHANLKSSNVLVVIRDENYYVKLTDFGFLPLLPARECSQNSILAISKSPELAQAKKLSQKADVYCFGIVLLEVITGRIPGKVSLGSDETIDDLSDWVRMVVNNDWSTDILDVEMLAAKDDHDDMLKLTNIALECTDIAPENRPKMIQVLKSIQEIESSSR
ncbi:putative leucine-rich repeat receptor-like protein kinase [Rosa sericea]